MARTLAHVARLSFPSSPRVVAAVRSLAAPGGKADNRTCAVRAWMVVQPLR